MAFLRFTVGSSGATQVLRSVLAVFLLTLVGLPFPSQAASSLPPGVQPCFTNAIPAGFGTLTLLQGVSFLQSSDTDPAESATPAPSLTADVTSPSAFTISNALLANTRGFSLGLPYLAGGQSSGSSNFASEAALLAAATPGTWNMSFQLGFPDGESFIGFSVFTLVSNTAPVPRVSNYAAAQAIDPAAPFSLNWTPWIGSGTNDRISLVVVDAAGNTVLSAATDCSGQSELPTGATGFTVPADRLSPGSSYTGYLIFGAGLLAARDDGALLVGRAFHSRTTRFSMRTSGTGGSGEPGTLSRPTVSSTNLVFTLTGVPGRTYSVQTSTNITDWTELSRVTLPASGTSEVAVPLAASNEPRFYRAISVGGGTTPGTSATLAIVLVNPALLRLTITGSPESTHVLEESTNLVTWADAGTVSIPEGSSNVVITVNIRAGFPSTVYRTRSADVVTPPTGKSPTLVPTVTPTGLQLAVTGGDPNRTYTVQQANADFTAWAPTTFTITTDANGAGQTLVSPLPAASAFFRTQAP